MTETRRRTATLLATVLALVLAVSGCAGSTGTQTGSSASGATRTVETAFGEVKIPAEPKKIITLEGGIGPLLASGTTPVATADGTNEDGLLPDEYQKVKDLPVILTPDGWDYDKIGSLKPDLMIGFVRADKGGAKPSEQSKKEFDKLNAIAPTVFILSEGSASTKDASLKISEILGAKEKGQAAKKAYDDKVAEIKKKHADALQKNTFAAVDYYEGQTTVYTPISWMGGILKDIGAKNVPVAAQDTSANGVDLSSEELSKLNDATIILHEQSLAGQPGEGAAQLAKVPTFQQLPAVRAKHDYGVNYFFADRYETALRVLEQLDTILGKA